jgi:uncharacterized membrane protein YciS (DUF1049 family)
MAHVKICCKVSKIVSTLIYIIALPFLILSFLHCIIPTFEILQHLLSGLFFTTFGLVCCKIIMAFIIKHKLCNWEQKSKIKLTKHQLIHFL